MIVKYLVIVVSLCSVLTNSAIDEPLLKTSKRGSRNKDFNIDADKTIATINTTDVTTSPKRIQYEHWSKWSACRKCRKIRRKACISNECEHSTLYEERPCNTARCRRKNRNNDQLSLIHKKHLRELSHEDRLYSKWTEWTSCSKQCMTKRQRYCKRPGTCEQNPDVQMAYCFKERTACHKWIQNMLKKQSHNKQYNYENDNTNKNSRKIKTRKLRQCGVAHRVSYSQGMKKIMGGRISKKSKWPWHVAVLNWKNEIFCGGTLIASNWVLTAAHCLRRFLTVRLNEYDISRKDGSEIEYYIKKKYVHPYYNSSTVDNDIALLKLPKTIPLPYACLPTISRLPTHQNCTTVGWGRRAPNDYKGSKYLREAQMPIIPQSVCKRSYRSYFISNNMFCAGYKNGGIDTCSGDSGGGFMCAKQGKTSIWTIQGITSFGEGCGKKGKYGIYTDVRKYLSWIKHIMNKNK